MKTVRMKTLFTIFLFSSTVPSAMQAMGDKALKAGCNFLKTPSVVVGYGLFYFSYRAYLVGLDAWQDARDFLKKKRQVVYFAKKKLLAKVDKQELIEDFSGEKYFLVSLEPKLVQQVLDALKALDIPDFLVEKILILGKEYKGHKRYGVAETRTEGFVPYAILFDNEFLVKRSPFEKQFTFLHEGGHVKADSLGESEEFNNSELNEVLAEVYAVAALTRPTKKCDFKNLIENLYMLGCPRPYFSPRELVYYAEQFFAAQQRGEKLDMLIYTRKIIADRNKKGYEGRVTQGAKKLLGSTQERLLLVEKRNAYKLKIEQDEKKLLGSTQDNANGLNVKNLLEKSSL